MARRAKTSKDQAETVDVQEALSDAPEPVAEAPTQVAPEPVSIPAMASGANGIPSGSGRKRGLFSRMYGDVGEAKPEELERVAAMEWEATVAPVMELLQASVPEASSPEEAARIWQERQGPVTPDPDGGAYIAGDAFETDARVYYRLLRRDYEKDPRPGTGANQPYYIGKMAKRGNKSHYLPSPYGQRPGIKGW